jgi:hypothetical protein
VIGQPAGESVRPGPLARILYSALVTVSRNRFRTMPHTGALQPKCEPKGSMAECWRCASPHLPTSSWLRVSATYRPQLPRFSTDSR